MNPQTTTTTTTTVVSLTRQCRVEGCPAKTHAGRCLCDGHVRELLAAMQLMLDGIELDPTVCVPDKGAANDRAQTSATGRGIRLNQALVDAVEEASTKAARWVRTCSSVGIEISDDQRGETLAAVALRGLISALPEIVSHPQIEQAKLLSSAASTADRIEAAIHPRPASKPIRLDGYACPERDEWGEVCGGRLTFLSGEYEVRCGRGHSTAGSAIHDPNWLVAAEDAHVAASAARDAAKFAARAAKAAKAIERGEAASVR